MTDPRPVISAIRDGRGLDGPGAALIAQGLADGSVSDAQAGAFAMAVLTKGVGPAVRVGLTRAMRDSGHVLQWDLSGPVVDKHSTGGIGDTVSLVLAPLLAARGVFVLPRPEKVEAYFGSITDAAGRHTPPSRPTDATALEED